MIRYLAAVVVLVAGVLYLWPQSRELPHSLRQEDPHWIYSFGSHGPPRSFGEYLEPVTSEGLREVRWDHKPPQATVYTTTASTYLPASTVVYSTTSGSTSYWTTCGINPQVITAAYIRPQ